MAEDYQPKPRALWLVTLVFCLVAFLDSWFRWKTFQYTSPDLAFYTQSLWLGGGHSSILGVPLMGHHAEPICFLLLPFFWIFKGPMFFVVAQTLFIATMPFTGYRIARRLDFERNGALWLGLATLLAPATGFMALHEFHPETLAAPFILLMIEARVAKRPGTFWIWFLLALACKENVGVMLAWFCAVHYLLEREKGKEWQMLFNLIPGGLAVAWVTLYILWLGPMWSGGRLDYGASYAHLGGFKGIVTQPGNTLSAAWHGATGGNLVWGLLLPFVFLPFLRLRWLVIAAPLFAQHLLSGTSGEWNLELHHGAPMLPLLWFGAAEACGRLYWREVMAGWIVVACVACQLWFGPARAVGRTLWTSSDRWWESRWRKEMLAAIPNDASVAAGWPYLSHLAKRERLFGLPEILEGRGAVNLPPTDVAVVDVADQTVFVPGQQDVSRDQRLHDYLVRGAWRTLTRNEFTLFLRDSAPPAPPLTGQTRQLDPQHGLVVAQLAPPEEGDATQVQLTLELGPQRTRLPWLDLIVEFPGNGKVVRQITKGPIGLGLPPGQVTQSWVIRLPASVPAGRYPVSLLFYDPLDSLVPKTAKPFVTRRFVLGEIEVKR